MTHKITLTGSVTSPLREFGKGYSFDMRDSGSPAPPKELPKSTEISYTVFVNSKQLKKAGITEKNIMKERIVIQGEPVLDVPIDQCPGEIGVVCFSLQIVQPKEKAMKKEETASGNLEVKDEMQYIPIDEVVISKEFKKVSPRPEKLLEKIDILSHSNHRFEKPLILHADNKVLLDGYTWYLAAKELNIEKVPVRYEKTEIDN